LAFADHGNAEVAMDPSGGEGEATLQRFAKAGVDVDKLAAQLQVEGAESFVKSWKELLKRIADSSASLLVAGRSA
jgi:transaldolase